MEHYCRICDRMRPNEAFSGKGHNKHICKACMQDQRRERRASARKREPKEF